MTEIPLIIKIIGGSLTFGVGIIGFFVKRMLNQQDSNTSRISDLKDYCNKVHTELRKVLAEHTTDIKVLQENKVGRPELKEELSNVEMKIESKISDLKLDIKEDLQHIREDNKELKNMLSSALNNLRKD